MNHAAPRFTAMPIAATTMTVMAGTSGGAKKRRTASHANAPEQIASTAALASGESSVARRQPWVWREAGRGHVIGAVPDAGARPSTSRGVCSASDAIADELVANQ